MLIKVFELNPPYSSKPYQVQNGNYVQRGVYPGNYGSNYTFIIGTRGTITNRTREKIERAIAGAWDELFDIEQLKATRKREYQAPPYGVTFVPDATPPTGETTLPKIEGDGFFIVFLLLETKADNTGTTDLGDEDITRDMVRALGEQFKYQKDKPRVAVVALYNCSLQMLSSLGDAYLKPMETDSGEYTTADNAKARRKWRR
jgi:hypothetical protein